MIGKHYLEILGFVLAICRDQTDDIDNDMHHILLRDVHNSESTR